MPAVAEKPVNTAESIFGNNDIRIEFLAPSPKRNFFDPILEIRDALLRMDETLSLELKSAIQITELSYLTPLNLKKEALPSFYNENKTRLVSLLKLELNKCKINNENELNSSFEEICNHVSELKFEHCALEITSKNALKFTLLFPEKKMLMLTKPISPLDSGLEQKQIIYSFFINRKLIASDVSEIDSFIEKFKKYLSM